MKDPAATAQRQQAQQQSKLISLITLPFRFIGVLGGSLFLCILIECVGMHLFWPEQGWRHAQGMLAYELDQLPKNFTRSVLVQEPGRTAQQIVGFAYEGLFVKSGLIEWVEDAASQTRGERLPAKPDFGYYLKQAYDFLESYLLASAYTVLVFLVRLLVLCLSLPLFAMAAFIGLVDGLVRRDIRRFEAGCESGFVYHRAKACLMPLAVLPWAAYLTLPVSVTPVLILLPAAVLLTVLVDISASSFKKHL
ncbi:TIGR03747 family integrating conjugative element membrane protein [Pseudomonas sp. NPDC089422]|uniref:TIGR03747 family integrating conjugative element membrane protein n=1 Tax=Pseudomonas sp. NPDC089422 TaxID=3364466 RepID=UPI0037F27542